MVFKPNTKEELVNAINLYCDNKDKGISTQEDLLKLIDSKIYSEA
jgi:hypothetical protein